MEKSKRKWGKHERLKRKKDISKGKIRGEECHEPNDFVSKLEHQESNSDAGRIMPYFTLYRVVFIPLNTFKRRFHSDYTFPTETPFLFRHTNMSMLYFVCTQVVLIMFGILLDCVLLKICLITVFIQNT
jgi:hypothetical protein